ncbi:BgTH12-00437, partial [Blumeria graminis f. sp. triticale]
APTAPKARRSLRAKATKLKVGLKSNASVDDTGKLQVAAKDVLSKREKRANKHSSLVKRIEKSTTKPFKRRRPNKKLITTMNNLIDALPDIEALVQGPNNVNTSLKHKSLKSRPGVMKKKDKLEKVEMARFGQNMAHIMGIEQSEMISNVPTTSSKMEAESLPDVEFNTHKSTKIAKRFAALRAWAITNMEKHPSFEKNTI